MSEMKCGWCALQIPSEAVICPECRGWRKDIHNEKIISYTLGGIAAIIFMLGLANGSWHSFLGGFKLSNFITSFSGWLVIGFVVANIYYYVKVSNKIKTWWWY